MAGTEVKLRETEMEVMVQGMVWWSVDRSEGRTVQEREWRTTRVKGAGQRTPAGEGGGWLVQVCRELADFSGVRRRMSGLGVLLAPTPFFIPSECSHFLLLSWLCY